MPADIPEDSRWLSYRELADARGISPGSAIRLVRRKRWPRRAGNDGLVKVAVPTGELSPPVKSRIRSSTPGHTQGQAGITKRRADLVRAAEAAEQAPALAAARERIAGLTGELAGVRHALAIAERAAEQARQDRGEVLADARRLAAELDRLRARLVEVEVEAAKASSRRRWRFFRRS